MHRKLYVTRGKKHNYIHSHSLHETWLWINFIHTKIKFTFIVEYAMEVKKIDEGEGKNVEKYIELVLMEREIQHW